MADGIQLTSNAAKIMQGFARLPKQVQTGILFAIKRRLIVVEGQVKTGVALKFRRGSAGLSGRVTSYAKNVGGVTIDAAIGFRKTKGFPYELSQEFGAKAAPGKAMAIPVSGEAKALSNAGQGPRAFPRELVLIKGGGKAVLVEKGFKPGMGGVQYVLVKSIPPRLNFRQTVLSAVPALMDDIVEAEQKAFAGMAG